jgi:hypothetical protein
MSTGTPLATAERAQRRGLLVSLVLSGVLFLLVCGLALYAFMLKVDLDENKRRLKKEIETRRQVETYLQETRTLLTRSLAENEQLKTQLTYQTPDAQAAASGKPALPVVVTFRASLLGKGLVAVIENTSERTLTLVLSLRNPTILLNQLLDQLEG